MHWKMSHEFLEYNFRCSVARAQAGQASCTPILSASGTTVSGSGYVQVHTGAEDASKLNVVVGGSGLAQAAFFDALSRRCRIEGFPIGGVDLFGFRLGKFFKRLRHALHPI